MYTVCSKESFGLNLGQCVVLACLELFNTFLCINIPEGKFL